MTSLEELKQLINYIHRRLPDEEKIDAAEHNRILKTLVDSLAGIGANVFLGVATPETIPEQSPATKCFYLATKKGNYPHFGDLTINSPLAVIYWNGFDWEKHEIEVSVNVNVDINDYIDLSNYAKLTTDNEFVGNQKIIGSLETGETRGKLRPVANRNREMTNGEAIVWDALLQVIKTVKQVPDSVLWDGHAFNDYLDQPVRRKDDVRFESVEVGDYLSGLLGSGAKIDKDGHAEVRSLTAWDHVEFPELRFNRVDVVSGELWNSIAFGVIDKVDTASRVATVKLVEGELLGLHVNDICRGIFHFHGENNDVDKVDDCGFLQLAGFSTSYFTPVQLVGRDKFKYTLRSGTSVHPAPGMKFAVYGNFKDKTRQASAYRTRTYTRYLRDVDTWVINADRHVYAQFGDINGLTVNGVTLRGHGSFQRNSYFTDSVIQIQGDEFKGADAYSVVLSSYEGVVNLNADGGISTPVSGEANVTSGGRNVISGGKNVVTRQYALSTLVQAHKGGEPLMFSETPGEGYFSVSLNAVGCAATVENGVVRVVGVTDTRKAHVNITVNCEGESVFDKRYTVVFTRDGEKGATGAMPRYRGKFVTGMEYVYNGEYRDIINHLIDGDERTFQVRHRGSVVTVPPSSSQGDDNWEVASEFNFLATGLILSKDAIIDLLQGNKILIKKENGTVAAGLAGGSVPFWIGGEGPEDSPVWINEEGGGQLAGGNIKWNKDGSGSLAGGGISWDAGGNSKFSGVLESKLSYSNFYRIFEGYDDEDDYHEWPEYYDPAIHGGNVMLDSVGVSRSLKLPPAIEWDGLFASFFTPFPLSRFVVDISLITSEGFIYDGWDPWEDGIKTTFSTRSGLCEIQSVDGKWYIKDKSKGTIK